MSTQAPTQFHKWHKIKQNIKTTSRRKRIKFNRNHSRVTTRRTVRYKSKEITKEEKCFACDKKTKWKKISRHCETLSRVKWDDGLATLIDTMKKNEDLSDQWLHCTAKLLEVITSNVDVWRAADVLLAIL